MTFLKSNPLPVKQIRRSSIPEKIISEIKSLIDSGHLKPGNKLPPERELAEMLGVSRPSVREALGALNLLGVVENRTGSGTYLADGSSRWPTESLSILFSINKNAFFEIFEARKCIESSIAALSAEKRSEEDLIAMRSALDGMKQSIDDPMKYRLFEEKFHLAVIEAARNHTIEILMSKLYNLLRVNRKLLQKLEKALSKKRMQDLRNHEVIYEKIKEQDKIGAYNAVIDHLVEFEMQLRLENNTNLAKPEPN